MIRLDLEGSPTAAERWAFELLVDLSRLLPIHPASPGGIRGSLTDSAPGALDFTPGKGVIHINRATLKQVVELAGARVEQQTTERDKHGRIPSAANPSGSRRAEAYSKVPTRRWLAATRVRTAPGKNRSR